MSTIDEVVAQVQDVAICVTADALALAAAVGGQKAALPLPQFRREVVAVARRLSEHYNRLWVECAKLRTIAGDTLKNDPSLPELRKGMK